MSKFPLNIKGKRHFHPFHLLIDAAQDTLDAMRSYQIGGHAHALSTMLLSSLAIEALANSIGEHQVNDWADCESANPMTKLRIIAKEMGLDFNMECSPWGEIRALIKFRNLAAHARPKIIKIDKEIDEDNIHEMLNLAPSKFEQEISYENAELAFETVCSLRDLLCSKLDPEKDDSFFIPH